MERIFIFSDVHANRLALSTIWDRVFDEDVTASWFLGDGLGLGPWPLETLDLLREILGDPDEFEENVWLAGNHDWAIIGRGIGDSFNAFGKTVRSRLSDYSENAIIRHRDLLEDAEPEILEAIAQMKIARPAPLENVYLSHGGYSTSDEVDAQVDAVWEYMKVPSNTERHVYSVLHPHVAPDLTPEATLVHACGHWHVQALWQRPFTPPETHDKPQGRDWTQLPVKVGDWMDLQAGHFYHINPGSAGFPSDRDLGRPSYAILEWDGRPTRVKFMQLDCASYDAEIVRSKIRAEKYDERIANKRLLNCYEA